ncbi:diguanylate cyclase (GGDEF)-like protein [Actinoplanes lutulentus]|uniref:GGDEF domain-containing protein n=1 Tax=Actinoplanes lutulentus TaxID=1287878 RepID=UPI000DBA1D3A|nr:GGDEF domain-containing protein [Actinoplanes lutulentus]MBB2949179.1 diguanylate cyclase (GGDEF)-like protein [Actinoplanes lutulentus]
MTRFPGVSVYLAVTGALTAAMPLASPAGRHLLMLLVSVVALAAVLGVLPRVAGAERYPYRFLALGLGWLVVANAISLSTGHPRGAVGDVLVAISHVHLLVAAVSLVLRRGRNDVGGLIDSSVVAIVVAALTWTALLQPGLNAAEIVVGRQTILLTTVLLLAGVLGALLRLVLMVRRPPLPLVLLTGAIVLDLTGTTAAVTATGSITATSSAWREMLFMVCYLLVGLAAMLPSAHRMAQPGPTPKERPFRKRVIFLTAAVTVVPLVSAIRELLGVRGDTALLTVGNLLIVVLVAIRVSRLADQREQAEARMRHQATHDLLTGLPNRAELWTRLDAALARERTSGGPEVVLLFCDLNGFKEVNDRLGHLAGDQLLAEVADRLRAGLAPGDTVARYGGDEFVLLSAGEGADRRLEDHVRVALSAPVPVMTEWVRVGASVGTARSGGGLDADELIRRADQAMYREKASSRVA